MSNYVNKIKKNGVEYEIHDSRTPTPTNGKFLVWDGGVLKNVDLFSGFTHSFEELDETLQGIIRNSFAEDGTSCTEAQWSVIKALLDKTLYLNYNFLYLMKTFTDGVASYQFGNSSGALVGCSVQIYYDGDADILVSLYHEV